MKKLMFIITLLILTIGLNAQPPKRIPLNPSAEIAYKPVHILMRPKGEGNNLPVEMDGLAKIDTTKTQDKWKLFYPNKTPIDTTKIQIMYFFYPKQRQW